MAYNKSSSKYPTPPERGRSAYRGNPGGRHVPRGREAEYQARDGIVMSPRPSGEATVGFNASMRDKANLGALGAGVVHAPAVGVPLAIGTGAADAYDANRATTALKQQTAETDAYAKQPFSGTFMKGDREAWDATYDDPRRANPPKFSDKMAEDAFYRKVSAAEEARHPTRKEYSRLLAADRNKAREHRAAMQQRTGDFEKYNERALGDAVVIGTLGAFSGVHPASTPAKIAVGGGEVGTELGVKNVVVPTVMTAAGARPGPRQEGDQPLVRNISNRESRPAQASRPRGIGWDYNRVTRSR